MNRWPLASVMRTLPLLALVGGGGAARLAVAVALAAEQPAPKVIRDQSAAGPEYSRTRQPWHIRLPRAAMLGAWQRLVEVAVPGEPLDQRFKIDGKALFVSPTGDDAADGSMQHPWKTLAHAVKQLKSNTVIYLKGGTYYGPVRIEGVAGTAQAPAALRAVAGDEVIIAYPEEFLAAERAKLGPTPAGKEGAFDKDGQPLHYPPLITVNRSTFLELSGLRFIGMRDKLPHNLFSESGIWFQHGTSAGCRVLYCEVENVGHCGIKGGDDCLFEGNFVHDLGQTAHDHGFYQGGRDLVFRRNLVVNCAGWGIHAYTTPTRMLISHNILAGNDEHGVVMGGSRSLIVHNVFAGNRKGGLFLFRNGCTDNLVAHNIFAESGPAIAYDHDPARNVINFNCLVPPTKPGPQRTGNTYGSHNPSADPIFVDPGRLDFRLTPGSPCIDAGDSNIGPFRGRAPDIGLEETGDGPVQGKAAPLPSPAP